MVLLQTQRDSLGYLLGAELGDVLGWDEMKGSVACCGASGGVRHESQDLT